MDNKKENGRRQRSLPTQMNLFIHIAAGAYLLYLAYSIYGETGAAAGGARIVQGLAVILFAVTGAVAVFSALVSLKKGEYRGGPADPDREGEENEETGGGKTQEDNSGQRRIRFDETDVLPEKESGEDGPEEG